MDILGQQVALPFYNGVGMPGRGDWYYTDGVGRKSTAVQMLVQRLSELKRAGKNLTRDSVLKAIETIKDWDPGWGLKYGYGGDNRRGMSNAGRLVVVKDGKWVKVGEWTELKEIGRK